MIEEVEKEVPSKTPTEPIKKSSNLIKFAVILGAILLLGTFALAYTGKVITPTCGDGNCLSILGENCRNCQVDCGTWTGVTTTTTSIRTTIPRTTITTTIPGTTVSTTTIFQDNVDVSVLNKNTQSSISNVDVYLDNLGIKCTTNQMGTCSFYATPENHLFKLRGEGIQFEEVRKVTEANKELVNLLKLLESLGDVERPRSTYTSHYVNMKAYSQ